MSNDGESVESFEARRLREKEKHQNGNGMGTPLAVAALQWPTPPSERVENRMTADQPSVANGHGRALAAAAGMWPTPRESDPNGWDPPERLGRDLPGTAKDWATPTEAMWRSEDGSHSPHRSPPLSRQVQRTQAGQPSIPGSRRRLNPAFVEWLMGWPAGWSIATTDCGCSEMEWSRWLLLMHSLLFSLEWLRADAG